MTSTKVGAPIPATDTVQAVGRAVEVAAGAVDSATGAVDTAARVAHGAALPARVVRRRQMAALPVALAGLAGFGAIFAAVRARRSEAIDLALMLRLQRRRRPWLDRLMAAVSWPGFPPQSRIIPPVAISSLWLLRFRKEAAFLGCAWGTGALSTALKALMDRPRPVAGTDLRVVAAPLGGSSFPSGHVITYMGTYGFIAYLAHTIPRDPLVRRASTGGLLGLILLVGPSRIYQGHHWPTDVTASYLLGTTYLIGVIVAYRAAKDGMAAGAFQPADPR